MVTASAPGAETPLPSPGLRRRWLPVAALVLATAAITVIWSMPPEWYDRGMRFTFSVLLGLLAALVVLAWFFLLSGARAASKVTAAVILLALGTGAAGSVRRVEFSGDMIPTFDFRWLPDRQAKLAEHLATNTANAVEAPAGFFASQPSDMAEYRGRGRDGVVTGPALARSWPADGPAPVWKHPVGGGYGAFVNCGQALITIEQRQDREAVVCYDRNSGRQVWVYDYPALFSEKLGGDGPRATPTVADDKVYALGATGVLCRLDLKTGQLEWQTNILEINGAKNVEWGMCGSPLVVGEAVIVNPGSQGGGVESRSVAAYDRQSGKLKWSAGQGQTSYASPALADLHGVQQALIFDAVGLGGFAVDQGQELWRFEWKSDFDINAAQPVVLPDNRVLITSGAGCALLQIEKQDDAWEAREIWRNREMKASYANAVVRDGYLYGLDEGIMACIDLETGKRRWKKGRHGHGQLLLSEDLLVVLSEAGKLVLVEATPEAYRELGSFQAIEGKTWNNPIMVDGRVYLRNHLEMACYDLSAAAGS